MLLKLKQEFQLVETEMNTESVSVAEADVNTEKIINQLLTKV